MIELNSSERDYVFRGKVRDIVDLIVSVPRSSAPKAISTIEKTVAELNRLKDMYKEIITC